MTSANFFNGYAAEKPTSRVMAPPGGRSNNIFGYTEDEPNTKARTQAALHEKPQEALANKTNQNENGNYNTSKTHTSSNIFCSDAPSSTKETAKPTTDRMKSSIFNEEPPKPTVTAKPKRTGFNPITGKSYDDEEEDRKKSSQHYQHEQQVHAQQHAQQQQNQQNQQEQQQQKTNNLHTSSRVSQPPGGRSTKLW